MSAGDESSETGPLPEATSAEIPLAAAPDRALWWEVLAVMAVGVVPHQVAAALAMTHPPPPLPYSLDALWLIMASACASYVVLYLIHRSGEPWATFGIVRPRFLDLSFAALLVVVEFCACVHIGPAPYSTAVKPDVLYPLPKGVADYAWMVIKYAANGFAEELVVRAYLITRIEQLLNSRVQAVAISTVLFVSYHLHYTPGQSVSIAILGLWYGGMYRLLRRVWPFALAHWATDILIELSHS